MREDVDLQASRLPDLPNAGYATLREKATSDLIMFWLRTIERNRSLLLEIVVAGIDQWRRAVKKPWGVDTGGRASAMKLELVDRVFEYMVILAGPNPAQQLLILEGMAREAQRTSWDKRARVRRELQNVTRVALGDLQSEQRRLTGSRKFFL